MGELKRFLNNAETRANKRIVTIQSEIDDLFQEFLDEPSNIKNKVQREIKTNTKFYNYGYLRAIKDVKEKIEEIESEDMREIELALEELNITERELRVDA